MRKRYITRSIVSKEVVYTLNGTEKTLLTAAAQDSETLIRNIGGEIKSVKFFPVSYRMTEEEFLKAAECVTDIKAVTKYDTLEESPRY